MASETLLPHRKDDEQLKHEVEEARKTVEQEIGSPSKEDITIDDGKVPKSVPEVDVPSAAMPNAASFTDSKVEDVEKEQEGQSSVSDPPESSSALAGEELVVHLEVLLVQEKGSEGGKKSEVPELDTEMLESAVNEHEVQKVSELEKTVVGKPPEQPEIGREEGEGKITALDEEEKPREESVVLEELKGSQDLELVEKPQEQIGVFEDNEKKEASEAEEKPSERTNVLDELGNKQASGVEEKLQERTGDLEGDTGKEPTSIIEDISENKTGILDTESEKQLASEVEEIQQAKIGVLEGEVEKKLALEAEEKSREQTGVVEEPDQKMTSDEETKTQHTSVLEEVEKTPEILESKEPAIIGIAKGVGILVDKIEDVSESLKEEHTVSVVEPAVSGNLVADVSLNENAPSDAKEGVPSSVMDVEEKPGVDETNNEQSGTDETEGFAKEEVEVGKIDETKNILDEKASKSEMLNSVDSSDSSSPVEASKEPLGGERASGDVGVADEVKKEIELKVDPVHSTDTKELGGESKKLEPSYPEQSVEDKLEKVDEPVEETLKSDATYFEPSKDVNDLKTEGIVPNLEAPAKPTQKQSNNILSKVKHSIGKVKKAITGRSPSSKTISVDAKGDVNVK